MTGEEKLEKVFQYINRKADFGNTLSVSNARRAAQFAYDAGRDDFTEGAKWADEHPANPWHSVADGDLPPKAKNNNRVEFSVEVLVLLNKNRLAFGRYDYTYKSWYVGLQRVYPTHWAEIPKLPENK